MKTLQEGIYKHIKAAYKNLDNPQYHFLHSAYEQQPYKPLIDLLQQQFAISETTDLNEDRALFLILEKNSTKWSLTLSLVGPYGTLNRIEGAFEVITTADSLTELEQQICRLCKTYSITLLSRSTLEAPVKIHLTGIEPEDTKLYQALFSASDILPWENWMPPE